MIAVKGDTTTTIVDDPNARAPEVIIAYRKQFCNLIGLQKSCIEYKSRHRLGTRLSHYALEAGSARLYEAMATLTLSFL